ncbi:hypothetical protein SEUCBS139899_001996 [Sporothrix eucalyptigena]
MPRPRRVDQQPEALSQTLPPPASRQELVITLPDKYRPGSAATRSQPISLVPPRDDPRTAAYIVDKLVTPLDGWGDVPATADDYDTDEEDERYRQNPARQRIKRTLCYVVAWPDEPYAQQLVPCTRVLEYVSPRTLEDWEYAQAEARRQQAEAAAAAAPTLKKEMAPVRRPGRPAQTAAATAARVAKAAARAAARAAQDAAPTTPVKAPSLTDGRTPRPVSSLSGRPSLSGLQIQWDSPKAAQVSVSLSGPPQPPSLSSPVPEKLHTGLSLKRPFQNFVEAEASGLGLGIETITRTTTNASANEEEDEAEGEMADSDKEEGEHNKDKLALSSMLPPPKLQKSASADQSHTPTYIPPPTVPLSKPPKQEAQSTNSPSISETSLKRKRPGEQETPIYPHIPPPLPPQSLPRAAQPEEVEEEEGDLYEVDRIEGDYLAPVNEESNGDMEGLPADGVPDTVVTPGSRLVRYFLVRWKGDWPPDQNPTWEPAENLPPRMVRHYFLKKLAQKKVDKHEKS